MDVAQMESWSGYERHQLQGEMTVRALQVVHINSHGTRLCATRVMFALPR